MRQHSFAVARRSLSLKRSAADRRLVRTTHTFARTRSTSHVGRATEVDQNAAIERATSHPTGDNHYW